MCASLFQLCPFLSYVSLLTSYRSRSDVCLASAPRSKPRMAGSSITKRLDLSGEEVLYRPNSVCMGCWRAKVKCNRESPCSELHPLILFLSICLYTAALGSLVIFCLLWKGICAKYLWLRVVAQAVVHEREFIAHPIFR